MVNGEVVLDSGCVRLRSEFGGTLIVVWPAGTAWEADRREVVLADGLRIPVGASFEGGGGYYSAATAGEIMPTIRDRVIACLPDGADESTADQVVLAWPSRLVEPDATGPPLPPILETSLPPASTDSVGGITRPPSVSVASNATTLDLEAWTFCFANGCADGFPPDPLPSVGADDELEVRFPLEGWGFQADFQRAGDPCARHQYVDLEQTGPTSFVLRPAGPAGTYAVTLFGRGDGDLFVTFEWKTTSDGPLPKPEAQLAVLADHDGRIDSYGVELGITNLARSPTSATASITVTAANGNSLSFDAIHRSSGPEAPRSKVRCIGTGPTIKVSPPPPSVPPRSPTTCSSHWTGSSIQPPRSGRAIRSQTTSPRSRLTSHPRSPLSASEMLQIPHTSAWGLHSPMRPIRHRNLG